MVSEKRKYRLVTKSDFEGIISAVLLKELDLINEIMYAHPKDIQDGKVDISGNDILVNLPYVKSAALVFDHHSSELIRVKGDNPNQVLDPDARCAAEVIYDYFGGKDRFHPSLTELLTIAKKMESAQFTIDEILHPESWALLNFLMDSRSGFGRFRHFRISNYALMINLVGFIRDHTKDEILEIPDIKARTDLYFTHETKHKEQIKRCSTVYNNLVVYDLRDEETIYCGNRFIIYTVFPECNMSLHIIPVIPGYKRQNTVFAVGKSIFNKTAKINVGMLMFDYCGWGQTSVGTCQIDNDKAHQVLNELIGKINRDG
ncbi:MAG: exopolyphosphatase [Candidatus Anammoxibacter sp.]